MKDDPDRLIGQAAREYNAPPPTPREAIWARIDRRRRKPKTINLRPRRPLGWIWIPAAAAAAIVAGIMIGRRTAVQSTSPPVQDVAQDAARLSEEEQWTPVDPLHHFITSDYLLRTEALITQFRSFRGNGDLTSWARDLLVETRLIMDSPAAESPDLKFLLQDLEFVLAQIVRLDDARGEKEREWINDGLRQRAVLTRLRMAIPAGPDGT